MTSLLTYINTSNQIKKNVLQKTMASEIVHFPDDINSGDFDPDFTWGAATSAYQVYTYILIFI